MTKGQKKGIKICFNSLNSFLKKIQKQNHIKNPDVVEEIRQNIESEIDRLFEWELAE